MHFVVILKSIIRNFVQSQPHSLPWFRVHLVKKPHPFRQCGLATPAVRRLTLPCFGRRTPVEVHMGLQLLPCESCCQSAAGRRPPIPAVSRAPPPGRGQNDKSTKSAPGSSSPGESVLPTPVAWMWPKTLWGRSEAAPRRQHRQGG